MQDKKNLLIVDDDIAHGTMLRILLDWQYEIFETNDGKTVIGESDKRDFDLFIYFKIFQAMRLKPGRKTETSVCDVRK
jgi:PleD family two-component response regulator